MYSAIIFLLSLAHMTLAQCPQMCEPLYAPVCGSDDRTYMNMCFLASERDCKGKNYLMVAHVGTCQNSKSSLDISSSFECEPHMKSGVCTREYFPICGSNGKTYANKCMFCYNMYKYENEDTPIQFNHFGECQPDEYCPLYSRHGVCTFEYAPVCATDRKTYPNLCSMCSTMYEKQNEGEDVILKVVTEGECQEPRVAVTEPLCDSRYKSGVCTKEYFPICGSDGKTYGNKCTFCYAKFLKEDNGEELLLNHVGRCQDNQKIQLDTLECRESDKTGFCTKEYFPICASNGKTYGNRCTFCFAKFSEQENGQELNIDHMGECHREPKCTPMSHHGACPRIYFPVCSNEGKTYANECLLCTELYQRQRMGENVHLHIAHEGAC